MGRLLFAWGRFCGRRPLLVIIVWVLIVVGVVGAVRTVGVQTSNDLELP